jgi:hypothetical protein
MQTRLERTFEWVLLIILLLLMVASDTSGMVTNLDRARAFTRPHEFNYDAWTLDAFGVKIQQNALGMPGYLERGEQIQAVMESLRLTESTLRAENKMQLIFADPNIQDKDQQATNLRRELDHLNDRQDQLAPLAESVLQSQVAAILQENGLTLMGQPMPPVLYHVSPLPMNLIISPRDKIEQANAISLKPDTSLEDQVKIEDGVAQKLDVSTLVVPVGGIGTYPTMVMRTDYFTWQVGTVIHEWTHNFLSLRPLGMNYSTSPELRTMNETTASIVENELAPILLARYYPTLTTSVTWKELTGWNPFQVRPEDPPPFDFRAEMHTTRVRADELLAEGKIEEAEAYMEARRLFFWDNGYAIRKLNQAYFAFYGAYADVPGGPAGEDPVGPAVRSLRAGSKSLADFLYTIAWMNSYDDLLKAIEQATPTNIQP